MRFIISVAVLYFVFLFCGVLAATCPPHALCPEHGVQSSWTSNKKFVNKDTYCEYQHPLTAGGTHKFWQKCD